MKLLTAAAICLFTFMYQPAAVGQIDIVVSENQLDFGCVALGVMPVDEVEVTVTNNSSEDVLIGSSLTGTGSMAFATSPLGGATVLPTLPNEPPITLDFLVQFTPSVGDSVALLSITVDGIESDVTVNLIGTGGNPSDPSGCSAAILSFFDSSVDDGSLVGFGNGNSANNRLNALRKRVETIDFLIQNGHDQAALNVTRTAIARSDGEGGPRDFVTGESRGELNDQLILLEALLGG